MVGAVEAMPVDSAVDVVVAMVAVVVVAVDIAVVATEAAACRVLHPMVAESAGLMVLQGKEIDRFVGDMDTEGKRVRSFLAYGIC